jgi:RimJ/RimL family protein N-acetyltransferase
VISDHEALVTLFRDEEVMESSDDGPLNTEEVGAWLRKQNEEYRKSSGIEILAVERRSTSDVIGYCGLTQFPDIDGSSEIEIGYRLIRQFWGCGMQLKQRAL